MKYTEEILKRKEELEENIAKYNNALFDEEELPFSDEEIDAMQEEYQMIIDTYRFEEEVEEKEKETFFSKIHWSLFIYGFIAIIFSCGILTKSLGYQLMENFLNKYLDATFAETNSYLLASQYWMEESKFWFHCVLSYAMLPLIIIGTSIICFVLFKIFGNKTSQKVALFLMLAVIVINIASTLLIFFLADNAFKYWQEVYENLDIVYYYRAYSQYTKGAYA